MVRGGERATGKGGSVAREVGERGEGMELVEMGNRGAQAVIPEGGILAWDTAGGGGSAGFAFLLPAAHTLTPPPLPLHSAPPCCFRFPSRSCFHPTPCYTRKAPFSKRNCSLTFHFSILLPVRVLPSFFTPNHVIASTTHPLQGQAPLFGSTRAFLLADAICNDSSLLVSGAPRLYSRSREKPYPSEMELGRVDGVWVSEG